MILLRRCVLLFLTAVHLSGTVHSIGLKTPTLPIVDAPSMADIADRGKDWERAVRIGKRLVKHQYADWRARGREGLTIDGPAPSGDLIPSTSSDDEDEDDEDELLREVQEGLWCACRAGDLDGVRLMLEAGADVGARDPERDKRSALHMAVINGNLPVIEFLIDQGARLDARADMGRTPLHFAGWPWECAKQGTDVPPQTYERNMPVVDLLVQRGANVNTRDNSGVTILHTVSGGGWTRMCDQIIAMGAEVNAVHLGGFTPLHLAAQHGRLQTVQLLLTHRAITEYPEDAADTPENLARILGHEHVVSYLKAWRRNGEREGRARERKGEERGGNVLGGSFDDVRRAMADNHIGADSESPSDSDSDSEMEVAESGSAAGNKKRQARRGRGGRVQKEWDMAKGPRRLARGGPKRQRQSKNTPRLID